MIRNYIIYIILIHLLASFNVAANSISHPKFYNIKQKGADFVAYNFIQDPTGYLWIGSNKGLYSYDGYKIRNYSKYGDNTFTQIYDLDISGDYIYLSTDNGLQIYDYVTDKYVPITLSTPKDIRSTLILDNKIWLGTLNGLYEYSINNNSINKISYHGLRNNTIYSTLKASNGDIYIGTYNGLFKLNKGSNQFINIPLPKSSIRNNILVNSLVEDKNRNNLWIGTEGGLYEYSLKNNTIKEISELKESSIKSLSISSNDNLYVGTDNGLFIYDGKDVRHYIHNSQNEFSIPNNIIWGTYISKNGDVWIGSESNFSVLNQDDNFNIIPLTQITNTGAGNTIYSILKDSKANLWLGGTNGLIKTNEDLSQSTWFSVDNKQYSLPHNRIRDIYEDKSHNLWIAGDGSINKYNYSTNKFLTYQINDNTETLNTNWAYNIFEDQNDNFWIGTCLGGIFEINSNKLSENGANLIADYNISSKNGLSGNFINQLIGDSKGNIWALLYNNGGVYLINGDTRSLNKIDFEKKFKENPTYLIADKKVMYGLHCMAESLD